MDANAAVGVGIRGQTDSLFGAFYRPGHLPRPQYLGAKYNLSSWIGQFIVSDADIVLDGFGGSQSVAFMMKQIGCAVYTNDFLKFCYYAGEALIENKSAILDDHDIDFLFSENLHRKNTMRNFEGVFFTGQECDMLDSFRANVDFLECPFKKALAIAVMCRSLTRKTTMGHFAHLKAMEYANNPERIKRNPSLARDIKSLFLRLVTEYNHAVFDNGRDNKSYHRNILDLLPELKGIDTVYYDPPYCGSHADYQSFYHLLETFSENWDDKQFINGNKRYYPFRYSGFDKMRDVEKSFRKMFALSDNIPRWVISYNDRSVPNIQLLVKMASAHKRRVRVEEREYKNAQGGRGSTAGSREYLLICE